MSCARNSQKMLVRITATAGRESNDTGKRAHLTWGAKAKTGISTQELRETCGGREHRVKLWHTTCTSVAARGLRDRVDTPLDPRISRTPDSVSSFHMLRKPAAKQHEVNEKMLMGTSNWGLHMGLADTTQCSGQ